MEVASHSFPVEGSRQDSGYTALKPTALTGCVALGEFNSLSLSYHIWKMGTHKDATSPQSHYQNQVR